jgi:hypothetical protein
VCKSLFLDIHNSHPHQMQGPVAASVRVLVLWWPGFFAILVEKWSRTALTTIVAPMGLSRHLFSQNKAQLFPQKAGSATLTSSLCSCCTQPQLPYVFRSALVTNAVAITCPLLRRHSNYLRSVPKPTAGVNGSSHLRGNICQDIRASRWFKGASVARLKALRYASKSRHSFFYP